MRKQMKRFAALSFVVFAIAAIVAANASAAVTVTWNSAANGLWSTGADWTTSTPPVSTDNVAFGATGAVGTTATTNEVDAGFSSPINTLWYQQQGELTGNYVHTTVIDAGQTLKIAGSDGNTLKGSNGNYSLIAGNFGTSTSMQSWTYISGQGTLDVSAVGGGNTGGDIFVRETQGASSPTNSAHLDLSGLATFNANIDQLLIGYANAYTSGGDGERAQGVVYLAQSNTITANSPASSYAASKFNTAIVVGYSNHNAPPNSVPSILYLGHTNVINADDITIGGKRQKGILTFNPLDTAAGKSVTIRGVSATRVDQFVIGDNYDLTATGSTADAIGVVDLRGGNADILASSIILGRGPGSSTTTSSSRGGTGTLYLDTGTIDTTSLTLGDQLTNWNATYNGVVYVSGGHLIVNSPSGPGGGSLVLGFSDASVASGNGTCTGTLNISAGIVTVGCDITDGGTGVHANTSTINLSGGTLDMSGHIIGSISTPIDTVSLANGTLDNIAQINAGALTFNNGVALSVLVSGSLDLGSTYDILNWTTESGTFATVNLPALAPGLVWDSSKLYVDGTIVVVPEPAALLMLIMAAGLGLMFKRLRRK